MSRTASRRLLAQLPLTLTPELAPASRLPLRCIRPFSNTTRKADEDDTKLPSSERPPTEPTSRPYSFPSLARSRPSTSPPPPPPPPSPSLNPKASQPMTKLAEQFGKFSSVANQNRNQYGQSRRSSGLMNTFKISSDGNYDGNLLLDEKDFKETTHQLHVYATRHNVHITLARPPGFVNKLTGAVSKDRTVAISVSAGNMGFRHSARKHYDSAFQLASLVMAKIKGDGIITDIQQLEVFLRGFGAGREAVTRALLGIEGASLRGKIIKVSDATRLKFGGTRSKKPRRLG